MKKLIVILLILAANCFGLELVRQKNVATIITFPLIDSTTTTALQSGATAPDSEIDTWADGAAPDGFTDCTNEATEIGTTGVYYLSLAQAEMNADYIIVQIKASDALTQVIIIRTIVGDPLLVASTDDGGVINVTGGAVDTVTTTATATAVTTVNGLANNVITAASINAAALNDKGNWNVGKTGYTVSTVSDKTGYSLTVTPPTAQNIWEYATRALTDKSGFALTQTFPTNFADLSISATTGLVTYANTAPPAATAIADAVWDEASTGHTDAGKAGAQVWTVLDDVPSTTEFEARTLAAADYVVTTDILDVNLVKWLTVEPLALSSQKVQADAAVSLTEGNITDIATAVAAAVTLVGDGSVSIGWNYDGMTAYVTSGGVGIDNATVKAYLTSDYAAYNRGAAYVKGETTTDVNGKFKDNLMLDPAAYTIVWYKQGEYGPDTDTITVVAP